MLTVTFPQSCTLAMARPFEGVVGPICKGCWICSYKFIPRPLTVDHSVDTIQTRSVSPKRWLTETFSPAPLVLTKHSHRLATSSSMPLTQKVEPKQAAAPEAPLPPCFEPPGPGDASWFGSEKSRQVAGTCATPLRWLSREPESTVPCEPNIVGDEERPGTVARQMHEARERGASGVWTGHLCTSAPHTWSIELHPAIGQPPLDHTSGGVRVHAWWKKIQRSTFHHQIRIHRQSSCDESISLSASSSSRPSYSGDQEDISDYIGLDREGPSWVTRTRRERNCDCSKDLSTLSFLSL